MPNQPVHPFVLMFEDAGDLDYLSIANTYLKKHGNDPVVKIISELLVQYTLPPHKRDNNIFNEAAKIDINSVEQNLALLFLEAWEVASFENRRLEEANIVFEKKMSYAKGRKLHKCPAPEMPGLV